MNRYQPDQYRQEEYDFHTRRSERYRHPAQASSGYQRYQFDDYGASARGGYGNEGNFGTFGNQGNEMGGSRNTGYRDTGGTYGSSRNYGNMGSYGGAQGFGSTRAGYSSQRRHDDGLNHSFDSGHGSLDFDDNPYRNLHGQQRDWDRQRDWQQESRNRNQHPDYDSFHSSQNDYRDRDWNSDRDRIDWNSSRGYRDTGGSNRDRSDWSSNRDRGNWDRNRDWSSDRDSGGWSSNRNQRSDSDLYGTYTSRRFQDRPQRGYYDEDDSPSYSYGGDRGNYMGSGYNRVTRGDYSSSDGNYGSLGWFDSSSRQENKPYGMSGYYSGGYGPDRF
ncbi:hypothetical protein [Botryobacter ruber]|uniref:hypothetical protein n=1 Tax=Botryobacter ruber TaxID=2171629 RepID=UPI000E0BAF18|nr:hypothetical protein [Botryobacter ruber]